MPTAAKLIAATGFAILGYFAAELVKTHMPEGTQFGAFSMVCGAIGLLCGWLVMGGLVGDGWVKASGYGVRVSVTLVFWALLFFSIYEMVRRATKLRYDGPMEAITAVFAIAIEYGRVLIAPDVLALLLIGGGAIGVVAEWSSRRWG
jgi:hypothetical protein